MRYPEDNFANRNNIGLAFSLYARDACSYKFCIYNRLMDTISVPPKGCTHFKTRQLSRHLSRHYDAELAKAGLKTTQYSLLTHVIAIGPVAPGELAKRMSLDASTLSRNLQPLIDAGLIVREAGADARSRRLSITAMGEARQAEARRHWKAAQTAVNQMLGAQRVAALHALLDECVAELQAAEAA